MPNLAQFLKDRKQTAGREPRDMIQDWKVACKELADQIRRVLAPFSKDLIVEEWLAPLEQEGIRYNAVALTIRFIEDQITILPKKAPNGRNPGRVEVTCGASVAWLLWAPGRGWSYKWEYPPHDEGPRALTNDAIEALVEDMLS